MGALTYLGIDGGGTKTIFLLVDETGREITRTVAGPSNWISCGAEAARSALRDGAVRLPSQPDIICGGFAGAGRPEGLDFYRGTLESIFPGARLLIETDAFIAYVGALGVRPGVLAIAGTGSIAIGRTPGGRMIRIGGWGPHFSDEGGGFWIGREAIRAALRSHDTGRDARLASAVTAKLGLKSITDIVSAWNSGRVGIPEIAGLFSVLIDHYPAEPTLRIVRQAASHLNDLISAALHQIDVEDCPVSYAGSVITHPTIRQFISVPLQDPLLTPERGAILWARNCSGGL